MAIRSVIYDDATHKLVPVEPTRAMLDASIRVAERHLVGDYSNAECRTDQERADKSNRDYWKAMLDATPAASSPEAADERDAFEYDEPEGFAAAQGGQQPDLPEDGFVWMTHPSRFDGKPFPVWTYIDHGTRFYVPFDERACEFAWSDRGKSWQVVASPAPAAPLTARMLTEDEEFKKAFEADRQRVLDAATLRGIADWIDGTWKNHPRYKALMDIANQLWPYTERSVTPSRRNSR